ncbi:MAG: peptide chain release factor N(5)-glutamine methyltransferase [Trichlorobacter sp.]|nr:peptide chain release factor N(5)-glutamine methyltransferase [Trichlorobacter sp.]
MPNNNNNIWTILKTVDWITGYLENKGIENAKREAQWLLCAATGLDRVGLYLNFDKPLNDAELAAARNFVSRRGQREPLQYILGNQEFDGLSFTVTPDVLIPRTDTETLVEQAVSKISDTATILDVGTGSGCIAISLAKRLPKANITALDISDKALAVAKQNARFHQVEVEFLQGNLFEPVANRCFNLIISNPPYIPAEELAQLQPEVRNFEPKQALDGGADGFEIYRLLLANASKHLHENGWLLLEAGAGQADELSEMMTKAGFRHIFTANDFNGIKRVVGGQNGLC